MKQRIRCLLLEGYTNGSVDIPARPAASRWHRADRL